MKDKLSLLLVYISMFTMCVLSVWYADYTAKESGRKFCDIINTVNNAYKTNPEPTTEVGKQLKQNYIDLQKRLDC